MGSGLECTTGKQVSHRFRHNLMIPTNLQHVCSRETRNVQSFAPFACVCVCVWRKMGRRGWLGQTNIHTHVTYTLDHNQVEKPVKCNLSRSCLQVCVKKRQTVQKAHWVCPP